MAFKIRSFVGMNTEQRRAEMVRRREAGYAPPTLKRVEPESAFKTRLKLESLINKETYQMKKTIAGKKDLSENATAAIAAAAKLEAIRLKHKAAAESIEAKYQPTLDAMTESRDRVAMAAKLAPAIAKELKELRSATDEARKAILDDLRIAKKLSDEFAPHFGDARVVCSMYGIMSAEKQRALAALDLAGPAVVRSAALQARMMLNDPKTAHEGKILASAVLAKNQTFDRQYRPISDPAAYASEIFAIETADVENYKIGVNRALAQAEAAEREIQGIGTSPLQKMTLGRQFPGERITPRDDIDDEGSGDSLTATDKIAAGLKARQDA